MREDLGRGEPGQLRRICGERHHLERHAVAAGAVQLSDAVAHWWVLDDDHRGRRREAVLWASTGHAAAVFGDELYDVLPQTRGGYGRLQDFGIRFGYERVVLHLEPHVQSRSSRVRTPPARCCCSTTNRCRGPGGARSSPPRCPMRSGDSKRGRRAPTACRARRRSAAASPRSCRSTASAATGHRGPRSAIPKASDRQPGIRICEPTRPGRPRRRATSRPRIRCAHPSMVNSVRGPAGGESPADRRRSRSALADDRGLARRRLDLGTRWNPRAR